MPHPVRITHRKQAARKADAQALVDHFAKHHPGVLARLRLESLEAATARAQGKGWTPEQTTNDAWRHLISRLRFLKEEGGES
jgi:hypothetical protein